MPLPPAPREIERLTEGWPGGPGDFELAAFAATFRAERPELSAPALDRVLGRARQELGRRERSTGRRRTLVLRLRRYGPPAMAAAVLLGVGAWLHLRPAGDGAGTSPIHGVPVLHPRTAAPAGEPASRPVVN